MASLPAIRTRLEVFDTSVVDLTENLNDLIELFFGTQLGGGTDIDRALTYCQSLIQQPADTTLLLISDLFEGGNRETMLKRVASIAATGVQMIGLLALNDDDAPVYDHANAAAFAELGIPVFACTPDLFPDLMAAALSKQDLHAWAATRGVVVTK